VADGVYAPEELEALHQEDAVASWSPADERGTPFTFVGLAPDGRIIGAVSLYGRASDGSWFIDNVIRDQDVTYKGLGQALVREALAWLWTTKGVRSVRVHAMKREERATGYWRWLFGRGHDFDDCFVTSAGHEFPAGGWNIELGWLPRTS
jgi:RimJ/RimL family protein N-acetyltransferase